jgi:hypothetical protein
MDSLSALLSQPVPAWLFLFAMGWIFLVERRVNSLREELEGLRQKGAADG